jgi:hypothetical protein
MGMMLVGLLPGYGSACSWGGLFPGWQVAQKTLLVM